MSVRAAAAAAAGCPQVDLAHGQVVGRTPIGVHPLQRASSGLCSSSLRSCVAVRLLLQWRPVLAGDE